MITTISITITLIAVSYSVWVYISNRDFNRSAEIKANALLERWKVKEEKRIRDDAYQRSRAVGFGKTIEHFVPFMKGFPLKPKDVQFYGNPVDYIGIKNRDSKHKCEIHFIEVKSGSSNLNQHQRNIKLAVEEGRVFFDIVTVDGLTKAEKTLTIENKETKDARKK
jgi:predicted Holliday junction resolvase-like endonuclease